VSPSWGTSFTRLPLERIDTTSLVIRLSSERVQIRETIVRPLDPIYIITKAIERIPLNYDRQSSVLTAFFRETTKQDNKNISLSEAVINIYKQPYNSLRDDQVRLFKGRKGTNTDNKEYIDFIMQGDFTTACRWTLSKTFPPSSMQSTLPCTGIR